MLPLDCAYIHCYTLPPWPPPDHMCQQNTPVPHQLPLRQPLYAADRTIMALSILHQYETNRT